MIAPPPTPSEGGAGVLLGVLVARGSRAGVPERSSLRQRSLTLGRGEGSTLRLEAASVGSPHAELSLRQGVWFLRDLGSAAGSWVDGERVDGTAVVAPGSTLRVGEVELVLIPHDRWEQSDVKAQWPAEPEPLPVVPRIADPAALFTLDQPHDRQSGWLVGILVVGVVALVVLAILALSGGAP